MFLTVVILVLTGLTTYTVVAATRWAYWTGWSASRVDMFDRYIQEEGPDGLPPAWLRSAVADDTARMIFQQNQPSWKLPMKPPKLEKKI